MKAGRWTWIGCLLLHGCSGSPGLPVEVTVPAGATLETVSDSLEARGVLEHVAAFRLYARIRGDDRRIQAGRYLLTPGMPWSELLAALTEGRVVTLRMTVPEGSRLPQIASRIAAVSEVPDSAVLRELSDVDVTTRYGVPGPGLEGYLFPDTYRFAAGVSIATVVEAMVLRYRRVWTPERRARLDSLGMTEGELITLASIVQAEARLAEEMPRIASVYHNRLRRGWLLQADPTVLYALGGHRERLLFAAIDSVADHPYNTYHKPGLPPGPIGAPGEQAIQAALHPASEPYMYFVARPDGSHVFSRTLAEHDRAVAAVRREEAGLLAGAREPGGTR